MESAPPGAGTTLDFGELLLGAFPHPDQKPELDYHGAQRVANKGGEWTRGARNPLKQETHNLVSGNSEWWQGTLLKKQETVGLLCPGKN